MPTIMEQLPTGLIKGRYLLVSADNVDVGTDPDLTVVEGLVTFTCTYDGALQTSNPELGLLPMQFSAEFDSEGYLIPAGAGAAVIAGQVERGIRLLATNTTNFYNPSNFAWEVSFNLRNLTTGSKINIPKFTILVPANSTQFLPSMTPLAVTPEGVVITRGPAGESAYQLAVRNGFLGTEQAWLNSLYKTGTGTWAGGGKGDPGPQGDTGPAGLSAYQVWLNLGNIGSEAEFIASLRGPLASLSMGTVTVNAKPSASITGDPGRQVLNLTLPEGAQGQASGGGNTYTLSVAADAPRNFKGTATPIPLDIVVWWDTPTEPTNRIVGDFWINGLSG